MRNASFACSFLLLGLLGSGCGSIVVLEDDPDASTTSASTTTATSTTTSSTSSSSTGGGGLGGAPGCPQAPGIAVVGCGFEPNVVVVAAADESLFVLDAYQDGPAFLETLWRIDLKTFARTALYSGVAADSPLERTRSVVRSGAALYVAAVFDENVIVRVPIDGGEQTVVAAGDVAPGTRLAVDMFDVDGVWFQTTSGIARVDATGTITTSSTVQGILMGASNNGALVAVGDLIHWVTGDGGDTIFGPITSYEAARADVAGSLIVAPMDAGLGGIHEIRGWYPDSTFTYASVPDGEGAGPPHFPKNAVLGGEVPVLFFMQGSEKAGIVFMTVGGGNAGLFGDTPAMGGSRLFRGPVWPVAESIYGACASGADGGDPTFEGAIALAFPAPI